MIMEKVTIDKEMFDKLMMYGYIVMLLKKCDLDIDKEVKKGNLTKEQGERIKNYGWKK